MTTVQRNLQSPTLLFVFARHCHFISAGRLPILRSHADLYSVTAVLQPIECNRFSRYTIHRKAYPAFPNRQRRAVRGGPALIVRHAGWIGNG